MMRSLYPPRTIPKIDYVYVERWPNNRVYVGWTVHPERRHRQHIGELARGAEDVRDEIKRQGGILPEMTVLAIVDIYDPISYEDLMMQTAYKAGFTVINHDFQCWLSFMCEAMKICPFVYANGRRCEGELTHAWQELNSMGERLTWYPVKGRWIPDEGNDEIWERATSIIDEPSLGSVSQIHLVCSLKGGHAGNRPDDDRMKFNSLSELTQLPYRKEISDV